MDLETFNKLKAKATKDVKLTKENLLEQSYNIAINYQIYLDILSKEQQEIYKLESQLDVVYAKWLKYYKFDDQYEWKTTKEIDRMIFSQDEYIEIAQKVNFQKIVIDYLDKLLKNIHSMTYGIREIREIKALLEGKGF